MDHLLPEICRVYGLGEPAFRSWPVGGAYSHQVWDVATTGGRYAVKVFDRTVDHARSREWRDWMAESVAIELAAAGAGIRMPRPVLTPGGEALADIADGDGGGTVTVRVHTWVDAEPVDQGTTDAGLSARVGAVLARLHGLPIPCPHEVAAGLWAVHEDAYVAELAERAEAAGRPWASALHASREHWAAVRELASVRRERTWPLISTHRDLGPKNVLRTSGGDPVIVDWDVAGPWTAVEEAAAAYVEWAGVRTHAPDRRAATALLDAYASAASTPVAVTGPEVFASWLVKQANWTEMHVRHALDADAPRRSYADRVVPGLLAELRRYADGVATWAEWLR